MSESGPEFDVGAALAAFWADYANRPDEDNEGFTTEEVAEHLGLDWPEEKGDQH